MENNIGDIKEMKIRKITLINEGIITTYNITDDIPNTNYKLLAITLDGGETITW